MKKQIIIIVLIIFFIPSIGLSQNKRKKKKKISSIEQTRITSIKQINNLHNGVLLVRLKTKKMSISALKEIGKNELAHKVEIKQSNLNKEIISAFRDNFDFCPVFFFYSDYSQNIRDKQFDKVVFLNDNLLSDNISTFDNRNFFTAEFGIIEQDTSKYYESYYYEKENSNYERHSKYYGGTNMGFGALIIKSNQFIQLRRPFPYYVRTFDSFPIKRKKSKVVRKMNQRLHKFYNLNH
ncbi:MAG: hypothetical protein IMY72_00005 [Bacteroidetes bacterium]|nr:hypothetical protein [Bacteroidota bacterium]